MNQLANLVQRIMRSRLSRRIIPWYAGFYQVDLSEIAQPVSEFPHLEGFFTRPLRPGARPFDEAANVLVSPVDGYLSVLTRVSLSDSFIVKGKTYQLSKLLGSADLAAAYRGGSLLVFYLSPADYHRIHWPLAACEVEHYRLGKFSWPVNDWGLKWTTGLTGNYRLISRCQHNQTDFLMVSVGALNVNSIVRHEPQPINHKMAEYGYFSFGSTVILVFPKDKLELVSSRPRPVKAGQTLANIIV